MKIAGNFNTRLRYYDRQATYKKATEEELKELVKFASFDLPIDYLDFLRAMMGVAFVIDDYPTFEIWAVEDVLNQQRDYPVVIEQLQDVLIIGTDLGDFLLLYYDGPEGFGLYCVEGGCVSPQEVKKIACSLTNFLVYGEGFDHCFDY